MLFIVFTTTGCFGQKTISRDSVFSGYTPETIRYDTIEGDFLYENSISAYVAGGDAIVKQGEFIKSGIVNKKLYEQGIFTYFSSDFRYHNMNVRNQNIHYDSASVFQALNEMYYQAGQDGTYLQEVGYNPTCGSYYKKFRMKIEVLYLGSVVQRIPLFMNCEELTAYESKNNGKDYEIAAIPTYLITRVFEWKELKD